MGRLINFVSRVLALPGVSAAKKAFRQSGAVIPDGFTVTAHTGAMLTPPNSLRSISASIEAGADIVEVDVTFRKDGTVVIIHSDAPAGNEGVLFEQAAALIAQSGTVRVNLDLKAFWNTAAVQEILARHNLLDRAFYTGVSAEKVAQVREGSPLVAYYINGSVDKAKLDDEAFLHGYAEEIAGLGAVGLNTHFSRVSKTVCDVMHAHGLLVSAWTVNKSVDQLRVLSCGADNITTKNPVKLRMLLDAVKSGGSYVRIADKS